MLDHEFIASAPEREVLSQILALPQGSLDECCQALNAAIVRGSKEIVAALLSKGADPNLVVGEQWPPIHTAVEQGIVDLVELLVANGASVDIQDESGFTPLQLAVDMEADGAWQEESSPIPTVSKVLIDAGADPEVKNHRGRSARDIAQDYEYQAVLALMPKAN